MSLSDDINAEIDRRKFQKKVDEGEITIEEIANAEIVIICPACHFEADVDNEICPRCRKPYEG